MERTSTIDTIHLFSISEIEKMFELKKDPFQTFRNYERQIHVLEEQISHLEAIIERTEDERDYYRRKFTGCI